MLTCFSRTCLRFSNAARWRIAAPAQSFTSNQHAALVRPFISVQQTFQRCRGLATVVEMAESRSRDWSTTQIKIEDQELRISSILMRDSCQCSRCVDPSSKQKNFSTTDIPADIKGDVIAVRNDEVEIRWVNDIPGYGEEHVTTIPTASIQNLSKNEPASVEIAHWLDEEFTTQCKDIPFDAYMSSDTALYEALIQLRKFGLVFLNDVPDSETSVSRIAERIGPIKHTLYGTTWDVRSVPDAKNVAYTSQDLGFHMDLLPMSQVPQVQFLHCIRSSSTGGKSLFTDSYRAAQDLWSQDPDAFLTLCDVEVTFHYDHPETHLYKRVTPVLKAGFKTKKQKRKEVYAGAPAPLQKVYWSPPFQGPFEAKHKGRGLQQTASTLGDHIAKWRDAAAKFNRLIHRPDGIHERLMKPGDSVIFANTRVLHARTAFDVADAGKERWLRGAYLDTDAWRSKEMVLQRKRELGRLS